MRRNPFSDNPETRTDVDTAEGRRLANENDSMPVLLMAYSQVDDDDSFGFAEDRWSLSADTTVGRKSPSDIAVPDSCMSKIHFRIASANGSFFVEDLGSTNGTFINGIPIRSGERRLVENAAVIRAGRTIFVFQQDGRVLLDPVPLDTCDMAGRFHLAPLLRKLRLLADSRTHLLLSGPTGVGKEPSAKAVAEFSGRKMVIHNAAKFGNEDEALSSLFGVAKGVYTHVAERTGLIERADGGILFLDEAYLLSRKIQKSLLRVVEDWEVTPIGATRAKRVDVRFILASNDPSSKCGLQDDLFARFRWIEVPPLKERRADIPSIFRYLLGNISTEAHLDAGSLLKAVSADHYESLCLNGFPSENVRGLIKIVHDLVDKVREGAAPTSAIKAVFQSSFRNDPVFSRDAEADSSSSPPQANRSPSTSSSQTDLKSTARKANLDLETVRRIAELYHDHRGRVVDIKPALEEMGIRLSRTHIAEVLDLLNLPRLKRSRPV